MLEWNVFVENYNTKEIVSFNIFKHSWFTGDCVDALRDYGDDKDAFVERIRRLLSYYYWSKCEWEIILSEWPPSKKNPINKKVSVYDQVMLNWNAFSEYIWAHKEELND